MISIFTTALLRTLSHRFSACVLLAVFTFQFAVADDSRRSHSIRIQNNADFAASIEYVGLNERGKPTAGKDRLSPGTTFIYQVKSGTTLKIHGPNGKALKSIKSVAINSAGYGHNVTHQVLGGGTTPSEEAASGQLKFEFLRPKNGTARTGDPSLTVTVMSVRNQKPIQGARVVISDGWVDSAKALKSSQHTGTNGKVIFRADDFDNWHMSAQNEIFMNRGNFDWTALDSNRSRPIRALFKVRITVSSPGYKETVRGVAFSSPGAEASIYLSEN